MKAKTKTMNLAITTAFTAAILAAPVLSNAAENPFALQSLSSGYMVAESTDGDKLKEGNCSADKAKEGNCAGKAKEGNCAADKAKEGNCSAKAKEGNCAADKAKEGNCSADRG